MGCFIDKPTNVETEELRIVSHNPPPLDEDPLLLECRQLMQYFVAYYETSPINREFLLKTFVLTNVLTKYQFSRSFFADESILDLLEEFKKTYSNVRRDSITEELKKYMIKEIANEVISLLVYEFFYMKKNFYEKYLL